MTQLMCPQGLQMAGAVSTFVAQQFLLIRMDNKMTIEAMFPFEALVTLRTHVRRFHRMFRGMHIQGGFRVESKVAICGAAVKGPAVVVTG